jgi:hypothetical protein
VKGLKGGGVDIQLDFAWVVANCCCDCYLCCWFYGEGD